MLMVKYQNFCLFRECFCKINLIWFGTTRLVEWLNSAVLTLNSVVHVCMNPLMRKTKLTVIDFIVQFKCDSTLNSNRINS